LSVIKLHALIGKRMEGRRIASDQPTTESQFGFRPRHFNGLGHQSNSVVGTSVNQSVDSTIQRVSCSSDRKAPIRLLSDSPVTDIGAQLHRLFSVDARIVALTPVHAKITRQYS